MNSDPGRVFKYEQYMIPPEEWETCGAPPTALKILREEDGCGPIGLAKHPEYGWAVLACGQGPFIVWEEE